MKRLWLLFAQTVTVALALWFIVATLKPEWLRHSGNNFPSIQAGLNGINNAHQETLPVQPRTGMLREKRCHQLLIYTHRKK
jgi:serine protease DegQ